MSKQARRLRHLAAEQPLAGIVAPGVPAVVAFSLPTCGECRARQAPALERLRVRMGNAALVTTLSVEAHPELVAKLGVRTVPATVIVDAAGVARFLNQGFADESRLRTQLEQIGIA